MKKVYLLLTLTISLLLIGVVKAESPFYKIFETESNTLNKPLEHIEYQNGYLFVDRNKDTGMSVLRYYNKDGQEIKSKNYEGNIFQLSTLGKDIFFVITNSIDKADFIHADESLEIVKKIDVPIPETYLEDDEVPEFFLNCAYELTQTYVISGNEIIYTNGNAVLYRYTKSLELIESHTITENDLKKYYGDLETKSKVFNNDSYGIIMTGDIKGKEVVLSVADGSSCFIPEKNQSSSPSCYRYGIVLTDTSKNKKWEYQLKEKEYASEVKIVGDFIMAVVNSFNYVNIEGTELPQTVEQNKIIVLDKKGKLIQTINSDNLFNNIMPTSKGFIVSNGNCLSGIVNGVLLENASFMYEYLPIKSPIGANLSDVEKICSANRQVYYLKLKIETKVTQGKGNIQTVGFAKPGEPVTFVVTPDEGYILGEVKVTDRDGNVVVFKQNTFTMPTSDVLVEATFLVKNAETKDIAILLLILLAVITGTYAYRSIKKHA